MKHFFSIMVLSSAFCTLAAEPNLDYLKKNLQPDIEISSVKPSPIPGLFEVQIANDVIYLTEDGEKLISGDLYDLKKRFSHTDKTRDSLRKVALAAVKDEDKIIYKAQNEHYKVSVFTDISCPYCTKFHEQIAALNEQGVTIEYLAFPRAGAGSKHQKDMQKIWCTKDKAKSLTAAKIDRIIPKESCEGNQTVEQLKLGEQIGVRATPTLVFSDGELVAGYVKSDDLIHILKEKFSQ